MPGYSFNKTILREYDIRGIYNETLFDQDAYYIGKCFGNFLRRSKKTSISVGYDGRLSSPALERHLVEGLKDCGLIVHRVGMCPTPLVYFSEYSLNVDAAIMVTGSHNPIDHNGFKISFNKSAFFGTSLTNFIEVAEKGDFINGNGKSIDVNLNENYINHLINDFNEFYPQIKNLRVVWDAGNGSTGNILQKLVKFLPGDHKIINQEINGLFPAHGPDPTDPKNLEQLQTTVQEGSFDIGIAFDGDGDRLIIIDNKGQILLGDMVLLFLSQEILEYHPGQTLIADVKASKILFDQIEKLGGIPLMWKTGHSHIKKKMKEIDCPLAGEVSGHIFFADRYYGFDDALYAALRFIGVLSKKGYTLNEWLNNLPKTVCTREHKIVCSDIRKFEIIEEVKTRLKNTSENFIDIDGIRVTNDRGWWLLRASNTQSALILRAEAFNKNDLEFLIKDLSSQLIKSNIIQTELKDLF
ncbi:MAG: hypothetical protein BGO77_08420 [Caedibacter sp. 37-49]|nr:MAG: hypothetical protein BGO77_08420 [Caedibacter sp. 37-49]